jgi:hypothetical protein
MVATCIQLWHVTQAELESLHATATSSKDSDEVAPLDALQMLLEGDDAGEDAGLETAKTLSQPGSDPVLSDASGVCVNGVRRSLLARLPKCRLWHVCGDDQCCLAVLSQALYPIMCGVSECTAAVAVQNPSQQPP